MMPRVIGSLSSAGNCDSTTGTPALASSDFLVLGDDAGTLAARQLARQTRRNIMQNSAWVATCDLCAVPFAAAGLIPPWGAAIGMSLSSLLVVLNALRLK